MQDNWAEENLQVIRVLMECSAIYRRTLAPVMGLVGVTGLAAGVIGAALDLESARLFVGFWVLVAILCLAEAFLIIRRQALRQMEPFWTPPTRRLAQALAPAFFAGLVIGIVFWFVGPGDQVTVLLLVPVWMSLYGLAMHAAGFFMPRGFRLFGWIYLCLGLAASGLLICLASPDLTLPNAPLGNLGMGGFFGGGHAAYGLYLYFTEKKKNVA
jgi:hypothetical protein